MTRPKITVYIVSHNYGKYLGDAIESVLRQTTDNWELIIIDDNSSDNTSDVMELYKGDHKVRLFRTKGIGLPSVCNLAIKEAQGELIIRLDGDDILDENALLVLGNYLDINPDISLVFPDYYIIDEYGEIYAEKRRQKLFHRNHLIDTPPNGACTLIPVNILKEIGCYRVDLGAQDGFDIWSKIKEKYKCGNVNLPLFYYRRHNQNLTNSSPHILFARRRIKRDTIIDKLNMFRPVIAVIPCRKHYDFCTDLWKQVINGKTLLQRNIEVCLKTTMLDYIIVAADNEEVKEVMNLFDDDRLHYFQRSKEDTIRSKKLVPTLEKIANKYDPNMTGITSVLYIQAPFITTDTLVEAITTLVMNNADCSFGVEEIKTPVYKRTQYGLDIINPPKGISTDFDSIYLETNTALATKNRNLRTGSIKGPKIVNFTVLHEESFFVNSHLTFEISKKISEHK